MTSNLNCEEFYHGPGIEALLRCGSDGCTLDVTVAGHLVDQQRPAAILEVLLQPLDRRSRLPGGWPIMLASEPLELIYLPRHDRAVGRSWLANVEPSLAPDCYYRVKPQGTPTDERRTTMDG